MSEKKITASTVARIAGNIAAGLVSNDDRVTTEYVVSLSVRIARGIVAEVERTEPK